MWTYNDKIIESDETLQHYGVAGMHWGVRRAAKALSTSTTSEGHDKAVSSLNKHRTKASKKIEQLSSQRNKLEKKRTKQIMKSDIKSVKMNQKATRLRSKEFGLLSTKKRNDKLDYKARKLDIKASKLINKANATKAKIAKNQKMQDMFSKGIDNIDRTLSDNGKNWTELALR